MDAISAIAQIFVFCYTSIHLAMKGQNSNSLATKNIHHTEGLGEKSEDLIKGFAVRRKEKAKSPIDCILKRTEK